MEGAQTRVNIHVENMESVPTRAAARFFLGNELRRVPMATGFLDTWHRRAPMAYIRLGTGHRHAPMAIIHLVLGRWQAPMAMCSLGTWRWRVPRPCSQADIGLGASWSTFCFLAIACDENRKWFRIGTSGNDKAKLAFRTVVRRLDIGICI